MSTEIWTSVPGYEGIYQVSNFGKVKRLCGHYVRKRYITTEHILKPDMDKGGYFRVRLYKNAYSKKYLVHRLVYSAFIEPIPEGMQVNHKNEIKTDNRPENLNLLTCTENINWGTRNGRAAKSNTNNVLRSKQVKQYTVEGELVKEFPSIKQVKRELGFEDGNIIKCCKGKYKTAYGFIWRYAV